MAISTPKRKTGRPNGFYRTRDGVRIDGLTQRKDGRWRVSGPTRYTFSEPDEARAIARFRQIQDQASGQKLATLAGMPLQPGDLNLRPAVKQLGSSGIAFTFTPEKTLIHRKLPEEEIWLWLREQLLTRPQYVAERVGIEQIGYLSDLRRPTPSPTLADVGQLYLDNAKISGNWRAKSDQFWAEFVKQVEPATTLRQLTQEQIVDYADLMLETGATPTFCRQRFGAVKAIINYPTKRGKWAEDCKRALALCGVLGKPRESAMDPRPIAPAAYRALLTAADSQMKAMLLVSLNCCMYGGEVAALDWIDLDLSKAIVSTDRNKTGVVRVAVLWAETIAALRAMNPKPAGPIFTTNGTKMQHNYQTVCKAFKALRKIVPAAKAVQFAHIRDGAYTAAVEAGISLDLCRLLAGHATGMSDHYVKRRPAMVAPACEAIGRAYFGWERRGPASCR